MKYRFPHLVRAWQKVRYVLTWRASVQARLICLSAAALEVTSDGGLALSGVVEYDSQSEWECGQRIAVNRVVRIAGGFSAPYPLVVETTMLDGWRRTYRVASLKVVPMPHI